MKKYSPLDHQGIPDINGPLIVADEGVIPLAVSRVDFKGAGVTVTPGVANEAIVTIPGGGGAMASADTLPVGSVVTWAAATAPPGYLLCNGQAVNRYTYASLFAVISTTYGVGDGANTFNLPNMVDRFPMGAGNVPLGSVGGTASHTHTSPDHTHNVDHNHPTGNITGGPFVDNIPSGGGRSATAIGHVHSTGNASFANSGGATATGTYGPNDGRPPYLALNFIIKAAPTTGGGADEVWIGPDAPADLSTELWYDTDA